MTQGRKLGLEVVQLEVQRTEDIAPALASVKGNVDALYVVTDPLLNTSRVCHQYFGIADTTANNAWREGLC